MTCEAFYKEHCSTRNYWLSRARRSAALTVPYLIPRSDTPVMENMDSFNLPWNGIGSRGVNNLCSRLLMALLPPTEAFFRFTVDPVELEKQEAAMAASGASEDDIAALKSEMELALNKLELSVLRSIETSNDRVVVHEALLHLIVSGNALVYVGDDGLVCYPLNRYVLLRDPVGEPLTAVVCETMAIEQLPASIRSELQKDEDQFYGCLLYTSDAADE